LPQGVFNSKTLYEILKVFFTDEEAKLCSVMPLHLSTAREMAKIWGKSKEEARDILEKLANKSLVYAEGKGDARKYFLSYPVMGFFEFSLMRLDNMFDKKKLSELFYKYMNLENEFVKNYSKLYPHFARVYPRADALKDITTEVVHYEKIEKMIADSFCIAVGTCFCRHKMEHMGMACDAPQETCLTFDTIARHLVEQGIAREISKEEALKIVKKAIDHDLVQIADNVKQSPAMVCNCCGCCCDVLLAYKKFGPNALINPSHYIARVHNETCIVCGTCIRKCPVNAISIKKGKVVVDRKICIGCGICARHCPTGSCRMEERPKKGYIPEQTIERVAMLAVSTGKVGNFLFDDQTSHLHAILRNIVNWALGFYPIKKILLIPSVIKLALKALNKNG